MREWLLAHYEVLKDFAAPVVGVLGIVGTLIVASRTFGKWRRERLEGKRIDVAIEALAIAYEAKFVFEEIRSRGIVQASADANRADIKSLQRGPQKVLERVAAHNEFFERAAKLEPSFLAVFGKRVKGIFDDLFKARRRVEVLAEALIEEYRIELDAADQEGRERRRQWRSELFASPDENKGASIVDELLGRFRDGVERECRPVTERGYRKP